MTSHSSIDNFSNFRPRLAEGRSSRHQTLSHHGCGTTALLASEDASLMSFLFMVSQVTRIETANFAIMAAKGINGFAVEGIGAGIAHCHST